MTLIRLICADTFLRLLPEPPRRIQPVLSGIVKANQVAIGISQISLTPVPVLVCWFGLEPDTSLLKLGDFLIEVLAFKVNDWLFSRCDCIHDMN